MRRQHLVIGIGMAICAVGLAGYAVGNHPTVSRLTTRTTKPASASVNTASPSRMSTFKPVLAATSRKAKASRLDSAIAAAIHAQTHMLVELPTFLPSIEAHPSWPATATTDQSSTAYQVTFWRTPRSEPVNTAQMTHGVYVWVITIQGRHYASAAKAYTALPTQVGPTWIPLAHLGTKSTPIILKQGIAARMFPTGVLQWSVSGWTMQVSNGKLSSDKTMARSIMAHVNPRSLPGAHGILAATATASGEQFQAAWDRGRNVYALAPLTRQTSGNGPVYDRVLSGKSSQSLVLKLLTSIKEVRPISHG